MKKCFGIAFVCFVLVGCSSWVTEQHPETPEERQAVAEHQLKLLGNIPSTLSGHDQDWDDAIDMAHKVAEKTICKTRLYEYTGFPGYQKTGKVKELDKP